MEFGRVNSNKSLSNDLDLVEARIQVAALHSLSLLGFRMATRIKLNAMFGTRRASMVKRTVQIFEYNKYLTHREVSSVLKAS